MKLGQWFGALLTLTAVLVVACGERASGPSSPGAPLASGEVLRTDAVVRYTDIEGGCWMLEVGKRGHFQALGLPLDFQQDGLEVRVKLRGAPDMVSYCQVGPLVHVVSIERK